MTGTGAVDDGLVAELAARAQAGGVKLIGEGCLLQQLTKRVLESALGGASSPIIWGTSTVSGPRVAGRTTATGAGPRR